MYRVNIIHHDFFSYRVFVIFFSSTIIFKSTYIFKSNFFKAENILFDQEFLIDIICAILLHNKNVYYI